MVGKNECCGIRVVAPRKLNPGSTLEYCDREKTTFHHSGCEDLVDEPVKSWFKPCTPRGMIEPWAHQYNDR